MKTVSVAVLAVVAATLPASSATLREQLKYQVVDSAASIIVNRVKGESCADFSASLQQARGSRGSGGASGVLKRDPAARARFIDRVAGPLLNKMIDCDLLPGK